MQEEIIIDGVNVAECNAYKEGHCLDKTAILLCDTNKCSNYNDCYYKQLQRLEEKYNTLVNKFFNLETDKAHLKQENFELKESLKVFNRPDVNRVLTLYKVGDIDLLEKKCDSLEQENKKLKEKSKQYREWLDRAESGERDEIDIGNNYRKALEEIRDLINKNDKRNLLNNIENKINEVLSV